MATITGRVVNFFLGVPRDFAVGTPVFVRQDGEVIAVGRIDGAHEFSVEVGDVTGELEISAGLVDAATVLLDFDGTDAHVELMHNGVIRNA